jgi:hypothetical protein
LKEKPWQGTEPPPADANVAMASGGGPHPFARSAALEIHAGGGGAHGAADAALGMETTLGRLKITSPRTSGVIWIASPSLRGAQRRGNPAAVRKRSFKKGDAGLLRCYSQ